MNRLFTHVNLIRTSVFAAGSSPNIASLTSTTTRLAHYSKSGGGGPVPGSGSDSGSVNHHVRKSSPVSFATGTGSGGGSGQTGGSGSVNRVRGSSPVSGTTTGTGSGGGGPMGASGSAKESADSKVTTSTFQTMMDSASRSGFHSSNSNISRDSRESKASTRTSKASTFDSLTMRAIRVDKFGDEGNLKLVDMDIPIPNENEILIKVEAIGVNPVEVMIRTGLFGDMVQAPYVPGSDVAGVVHEVGNKVTKFRKGDRVYTMKTSSGAYAEFCTAPSDYTCPLRNSLTFSQGAAIGLPYTVAYKGLFIRAQAQKGETLLIHGGSGAVGQAAIQMAKARGITVIATAGTPEGMAIVKRQGADHVYNHRELDYMNKIWEVTGGKGVNIILEMMANKNLVADLGVVAPRARIVIIGNKGAIPEFNPSLTMGVEADILGTVVQVSTLDEYRVMMNAINQGQGHWLKPEVAKVYALENSAEAHKDIASNTGSKGKLIIKPAL